MITNSAVSASLTTPRKGSTMHTPQTDLMAHKITSKVARYSADSQRHTTYRAGEVEGWKSAWEFLTDISATDENLDEAARRHRDRDGGSA